jgi:hypothetical protein
MQMWKYSTSKNYSQGLHLEALSNVSRPCLNTIAGTSSTTKTRHRLNSDYCSWYNTAATNRTDRCADESTGNSAASACIYFDSIRGASSTRSILHIYIDASS